MSCNIIESNNIWMSGIMKRKVHPDICDRKYLRNVSLFSSLSLLSSFALFSETNRLKFLGVFLPPISERFWLRPGGIFINGVAIVPDRMSKYRIRERLALFGSATSVYFSSFNVLAEE